MCNNYLLLHQKEVLIYILSKTEFNNNTFVQKYYKIISISDLHQKAVFSVYALQPPRRLEEFLAMKVTKEIDPQKLRNRKFNYLILDHSTVPSQFVYNKFKTYKFFGQQIYDIKKDLADVLKEYIKTYKFKKIDIYLG